VEGIEHKSDGRVIRAAHHFPCVAMIGHVAAPGQRLIANAQASLARPVPKLVEIQGGAIDPAKCGGRHIGADEHEIGPEGLHDVELAFGTVECAPALRLRQSFKIPERLEHCDLKPGVADHPAHFCGPGRVGQEIVLENLDAIEPGRRNGPQLFSEVAGQRHGSDTRPQHQISLDVRNRARVNARTSSYILRTTSSRSTADECAFPAGPPRRSKFCGQNARLCRPPAGAE
jgi:hypothetical protein